MKINNGLLGLNDKSRMRGHVQVRFYERQRGKFPLSTRLVIHCNSKEIAEGILAGLKDRLAEYGLELHPAKTKMVYCKNYFRNEEQEYNSFVFLSYSFQPRTIRDVFGKKKCFVIFNAAICQQAKTAIRAKLKEVFR